MMTEERLAEIEGRAKAATAGPWYAHNTDDSMYMNCYSVTTSEREPDTEFTTSEDCDKTVVAMTLYQEQRIVCHEAGKWEQDAEFIAHARTDVPDLIAEVQRLNDLVYSLRMELFKLKRPRYLGEKARPLKAIEEIDKMFPHARDGVDVEKFVADLREGC